MNYSTGIFEFPQAITNGPRTDTIFFNFGRTVKKSIAGFSKIVFGFSPSEGDQHLGKVTYSLETNIDDDVVTITCTFGVTDWDDDGWEKPYEGKFEVSLIVEFEDEGKSNLSIIGVEHSQGIQYFNSTLGENAKSNNFLSIVKNKDLVLRVYTNTETGTPLPVIGIITGTLEFRDVGSQQWRKAIKLNTSISPIKGENIDRTVANNTLNFLIPAGFLSKNIEYRARVLDRNHPNNMEYSSEEYFGKIDLVQTKDLKIYVVGIHYTGNNQNLPAPQINQFQIGLSVLRQIYPLNKITLTGYKPIDFSGDLSTPTSAAWEDLRDELFNLKGGSSDIYFGILPGGVIFTPVNGLITNGMEWDPGCAVARVTDSNVIAHEIGHCVNIKHVSGCLNPDKPDPDYPDYGFINKASIGEVGIDATGLIYRPQNFNDIMSYCNARWISPYHYQKLLRYFYDYDVPNTANLQENLISIDSKLILPDNSEKMVMTFKIYSHGKNVELTSSFIYATEEIMNDFGERTPYIILLLDNENNVLYTKRLFIQEENKDLDSAYLNFSVIIPYLPNATKLEIICSEYGSCNEKIIFCKCINKNVPSIKMIYPTGGEKLSGNVTIKWEAPFEYCACTCISPLRYLVQYSINNGLNFTNISPQLTQTEYTVDFDNLKGSENAIIRVISSMELGSTYAITKPFSVAIKPRKASIVYPPNNNSSYSSDTIIKFIGDAFSSDFLSPEITELVWYSDKDGIIGYGNQLFTPLSFGEHQISLKAPDGLGGETSDKIKITIETPIPD